MKKLYIVCLLLIVSFKINAQNDDTEQYIERDILGADNINYDAKEKKQLIGAARSSRNIEELPLTFYIINHNEIVTNGYITLCDILKNVPGIRISQPASSECGEGFVQRGMAGNTYTKILVNGIDIKPSGLTSMPLGANLPIRQAEKIEIIYGPASASYGNDACGGVINIITKKAGDKPFANADLMYGTNDKRYINFNVGSKIGHGKNVIEFTMYGSDLNINDLPLPDSHNDLYYRWDYFFQNSETIMYQGYNVTRDFVTEDVFSKLQFMFVGAELYFLNYKGDLNYPEINKRPQQGTQMGADIRYRGITLSYNMLHRMDFTNHGLTGFTFNLSDPQALYGEYIHRFALSGDYEIGNVTTNTSLHLLHHRMDENSYRTVNWNTAPQYFWGAGDDLGFEENIIWKAIDQLSIVGGASFTYSGVLPKTMDYTTKFDPSKYKMFAKSVDFEYPIIGSFGIYPYTYYTAGAYLQADIDFHPISVTVGSRYDYHSEWGSSINPRIAALWKITDRLSLRASQGFAYKVPAPGQMYYSLAIPIENEQAPNGYVIAYHSIPSLSNNLTPEKISATELGFRMYFNQKKYLELIAYTNRTKNPLIKKWVAMDNVANYNPDEKYYTTGGDKVGILIDDYVSEGVINLMNQEYNRRFTRSYANEEKATSKLNAIQLISVLQDIYEPMHFNIRGSLTYSFGEEFISTNNAGETRFTTLKYVRGVPEYMGQLSFEIDLFKVMHIRLDNIYCSKFGRRYYNGVDNRFFWSTEYYNLDAVIAAKLSKNLTIMVKGQNLTNKLYGGMDVFEMDIDLPYNPQLLRNFAVGISYDF